MPYFDASVCAVPTTNKQKYIDHATRANSVFVENGATSVRECWQADVPHGKITDFYGAVAAKDDESVVFSWIEWPDKATSRKMFDHVPELMQSDDRFNPDKNPMPFDGARMIYGGFTPIVEHGRPTPGAHVQGFIVPVKADMQESYRQMAENAWTIFKEYGALRIIEAWQEDVPTGKQTDFFRAVKATPDERIVFSFIEWPSRAVCDAAGEKMQADERMQSPDVMPFDPARMVYGGFAPVVELGEGS